MAQLKMIHKFDNIQPARIPEGLSVRPFRSGEELIWVELCKNGLVSEDATIKAFEDAMLSQKNLVPERDIFFFCDENDTPVATICGFINDNGFGNVHMVAASPVVKGRGVGLAMANFILAKLRRDLPGEGALAVLTTDDWRVPAVVGYLRSGFHPVLYDTGMEERWRALCDKLNFHGIEMLTETGEGTGIIL